MITIHNIAFQGIFPAELLAPLKLPRGAFTLDGLEYYGQISFLKGGLTSADRLTTVSPTYAREICTPAFGMGLDGVLRQRRAVLSGITNGIDGEVWNPQSDPNIESHYGGKTLEAKAANKAALQRRLGLDVDDNALLFCVVSRLTAQKGFDLLLEALPTVLGNGGQLALLGSGETGLQEAFLAAARTNPGRIGVVLGYDEPLSHQMQARRRRDHRSLALRALRPHPALWPALWHAADRRAHRRPRRHGDRRQPGRAPRRCRDRLPVRNRQRRRAATRRSSAPSSSMPTGRLAGRAAARHGAQGRLVGAGGGLCQPLPQHRLPMPGRAPRKRLPQGRSRPAPNRQHPRREFLR